MTEEDFKKKLNPTQYRILREKGTEEAHTGVYVKSIERGLYTCAACGYALFFSFRKFDAKNGWPAFKAPVSKKHIELEKDAEGMEVRCAQCHSHIGYFEVEKKYYRVNSIALSFIELGDLDQDDGDSDEKKEEKSSNTTNQSPLSVTNVSLVAGGIVLGAGATALILTTQAALMLCQNLGMIAAPTTTPITQTSATFVAPPASGAAGTPRATSGAAPAQSAAQQSLTPPPPVGQPASTGSNTGTEAIPPATPPNPDVPASSDGTGTI